MGEISVGNPVQNYMQKIMKIFVSYKELVLIFIQEDDKASQDGLTPLLIHINCYVQELVNLKHSINKQKNTAMCYLFTVAFSFCATLYFIPQANIVLLLPQHLSDSLSN